MNEYVNRAAFSMNLKRAEVVIQFIQESPKLVRDDGTIEPQGQLETMIVSRLVMTVDCAKDICEKLLGMIKQADQSQSEG